MARSSVRKTAGQKAEPEILKVGVISDTHDFFDPKIRELFADVDHIIHGGDVGLPWIILQLEEFAGVTAVSGNTDESGLYKETQVAQVGSRKFLVHHIVDPLNLTDKLKRRIIRDNPDVVVFGHTHKPFCQMVGNTLFLNPGYAGRQRLDLPRTVALLTCDQQGITADFINL